MEDNFTFSYLVGRTIHKIEINDEKDEMLITLNNEEQFLMWHDQDCCETVRIEDITGDLTDVIGSRVLLSEEICSEQGVTKGDDDSSTWTFYKLATIKGSVTIRWYGGSSSGYYSEKVSFSRVSPVEKAAEKYAEKVIRPEVEEDTEKAFRRGVFWLYKKALEEALSQPGEWNQETAQIPFQRLVEMVYGPNAFW